MQTVSQFGTSTSLVLLEGQRPAMFAAPTRGPVRLMSGRDARLTYARGLGREGADPQRRRLQGRELGHQAGHAKQPEEPGHIEATG